MSEGLRAGAAKPGSRQDVRAMYEAFPYPSPLAGGSLIEDIANCVQSLFGDDQLIGKRILDAGCGTGHRLAAVARRYPEAHVTGVDMTAASLEVARDLASAHDLRNVEFCQSDLTSFEAAEPFDVIVSSGVLHHLENPGRGHEALARLLSSRGVLAVWHYHSLGEHQRLIDRELILTMWKRESGFDQGLQVMEALGLQLETKRYGSSASQATEEVSQRSLDVDAYLHPIVNAYRFDEAIRMYRDCAHLEWAAVNNVNLVDRSKLLDLGGVETGDLAYFCQRNEDLFADGDLRARFAALEPLQKLRVIEIKLKPTGFTIVGGRKDALDGLPQRVRSNAVIL